MSNVYKTLTETSERKRKRKSKIKTKTKMETKFSECDVEQIFRNLYPFFRYTNFFVLNSKLFKKQSRGVPKIFGTVLKIFGTAIHSKKKK